MADNDQPTDVAPVSDAMDLGAALLEESASSTESSTEQTKATEEPTDTKAAESTPNKEPEPAESTETEEETPDKTAETSEETDKDDKPKRDAEARKQQLNNEIRQLVAEKKQRQAEVERLNSQNYRTESIEELVNNGMDPDQAEAEAQRQSWEMEKFNRDVTDLNQTIDVQVAQVMSDFPWADPQHPEYDKNTAKSAFELFQKAGQPVIDQRTGLVTNINVMPYDIYSAFDTTRRSSAESGAVAGQKATEKMLAAAEPSSSAQPTSGDGEDDPFLQGFNKVK